MPTPEVTAGAMLTCSFGAIPSAFIVLPENRVTAGGTLAGNTLDNKPIINIPSFGVCTSAVNPEVVALTAAALGVPTPAPCVPVIPAPWLPGAPTVTIADIPVLDMNCKLLCAWMGVITVTDPAQMTVIVP